MRALAILKENDSALDVCAEALLEHETIDGKHVQEILEHGAIQSPVVKREAPTKEPEPKSDVAKESEKESKSEDDGLAGESTPAGIPA